MVDLLCGNRIPAEPVEPIARQCDAAVIQLIEAQTSAPLHANQPGAFEQLKMARRRRPGVGEQTCDGAGAHFAIREVQADQNSAPRRMGESRENQLVRVGCRDPII
jgi:hypothetical protein